MYNFYINSHCCGLNTIEIWFYCRYSFLIVCLLHYKILLCMLQPLSLHHLNWLRWCRNRGEFHYFPSPFLRHFSGYNFQNYHSRSDYYHSGCRKWTKSRHQRAFYSRKSDFWEGPVSPQGMMHCVWTCNTVLRLPNRT